MMPGRTKILQEVRQLDDGLPEAGTPEGTPRTH